MNPHDEAHLFDQDLSDALDEIRRYRHGELTDIYREYARDPAFARLRAPGYRVVPGRGSLDPRYVFVGEAPGYHEQRERKPFRGRAGDVFNRLLRDVGLNRREVFVTNVVKYRPINERTGTNRTPNTAEQIASWPYVKREIDVFDSTPVVTMGRVAHAALGPAGIRHFHGTGWYDASRMYGAIYHPATVLYDEDTYDALAGTLARLIEEGL